MASFAQIYAAPPPDPNEVPPLYNRPASVYGITLPFHILTWAAVFFRLYTRFRLVREPGWDDYLIMLGAVFNLVSLIGFYGAIKVGLGTHFVYIKPENMVSLFQFLYFRCAAYYTCAGLVKLSLLCQYLRLFREGLVRKVCIVMLVLTSLWASFWFFQGWFPCFPVHGFWHRTQVPPPRCWGTGFGDMDGARHAFLAFAASNMALDTMIFCIPIALYFRPGLASKQVFALIALFSLGSIVVLLSVLRLWTVLRHNASDVVSIDFTWWYALTMTLASLEIDFAIICASIPIFWPVIIAALPQIFVTQEVRVTHHHPRPSNNNMDYEMSRTDSVKSNDSQKRLTPLQKTDYSDQLVIDHVVGKVPLTTEVVSEKRKKRRER